MTEQVVRRAVCVFRAARAGHDKRRKSEAVSKLARAAADFLSADGHRTSGGQRLKALAAILAG